MKTLLGKEVTITKILVNSALGLLRLNESLGLRIFFGSRIWTADSGVSHFEVLFDQVLDLALYGFAIFIALAGD